MLPQETLKRVLAARAGFETIEEQVGDNRVRFFGRVRPHNMPAWLAVMRTILIASGQSPWTADLSRQYFLRGDKVFRGPGCSNTWATSAKCSTLLKCLRHDSWRRYRSMLLPTATRCAMARGRRERFRRWSGLWLRHRWVSDERREAGDG